MNTHTASITAFVASVAALAAAATIYISTPAATPAPTAPAACQTEDSDACTWDATTQGNHLGRSFTAAATPNLPSCVTEDSDDCIFDAATRGNGLGSSFITYRGVTYLATK